MGVGGEVSVCMGLVPSRLVGCGFRSPAVCVCLGLVSVAVQFAVYVSFVL